MPDELARRIFEADHDRLKQLGAVRSWTRADQIETPSCTVLVVSDGAGLLYLYLIVPGARDGEIGVIRLWPTREQISRNYAYDFFIAGEGGDRSES